jgi:DNA-directed RNA polymerase specialized sigma24 family protein
MTLATKPAPFGPDLRAALVAMVRKRVPDSEVEDIVQQALAEAIESPHAPKESEALRRWIFGVAKNKVVDYHRRAGRESFDMPDVAGTPAPHVEADLLRWAERNLPDGAENQKTLDWMLREGEGEKLESIAESEKLPPPRVRQRVSRLRRHFKENWQREVALLAALGVIVSAVVFLFLRKDKGPEAINPENPVVDPRAEPVRRLAMEKCANADWKNCLDGLDEARRLDPAGDKAPAVQQARQAAQKALEVAPPLDPSAVPSAVPTTAPPPAPEPSSILTPKPFDSAGPRLQKPPAPKFARPTESFTTPPAPAPSPTNFPPSVSKEDGATTKAPSKSVGKPQGKTSATPAPKGGGGSIDFGSDFGSGGGSGGGAVKGGGGKKKAPDFHGSNVK